jgi:hypothetical protein
LLNDVLKTLREALSTHKLSGLDIQNTDRVFVAPVLNNLGWALADIMETVSGYVVDEGMPAISYAFFSEGKPIFLVEIKPLHSDLTNISYKHFDAAKKSQASYLAISNGAKWHIYNVEAEKKLVLIIDVLDASAEDKLNLLSKTNLKNKFLDQYIDSNPVPEEIPKINLVARGYGVSDDTHKRLTNFKRKVGTSAKFKDEVINNSVICETLFQIFLDAADKGFDYKDISNRVILKDKIIECLSKHLTND